MLKVKKDKGPRWTMEVKLVLGAQGTWCSEKEEIGKDCSKQRKHHKEMDWSQALKDRHV